MPSNRQETSERQVQKEPWGEPKRRPKGAKPRPRGEPKRRPEGARNPRALRGEDDRIGRGKRMEFDRYAGKLAVEPLPEERKIEGGKSR